MRYLNKLPNFRRSPPGMERRILRRLPAFLLAGTLIPLLIALASHLWPPDPAFTDVDKYLTSVLIWCVAIIVTLWGAALTVAIGCVTVVLMKGPAYVADAYELNDRDEPE